MNEIVVSFFLFLCTAAGALNAFPAGGSVTGRVVITKIMTRKRVMLPAYDMRGVPVNTASSSKPANSDPTVDELSRVVVYLEGPGLKSAAPSASTLSQKNRRFDPEIVVVPVGSSVSFPNNDPIF